MNLFILILFIKSTIRLLSLVYKKKFFLSILICLEIILLNLVIFNFIIYKLKNQPNFLTFSLLLIALAAIEARVGISIIALISRKFSKKKIKRLKLLKN